MLDMRLLFASYSESFTSFDNVVLNFLSIFDLIRVLNLRLLKFDLKFSQITF